MRRLLGACVAGLLVAAGAALATGSAASIGVTSRTLTQFSAPGPTTTTTPGDTTAPALTALELKDLNTDGVAETVEASFDETIACEGGTCSTARWSVGGAVPSGGTLQTVTVSGSKATLTFSGTTKNTAVGTLTLSLSAGTAGGRIQDAAGNRASFGATTPADKAGPVATSFVIANGAANGSNDQGHPEGGDHIAVVFSERLAVATLLTAWTGNAANQSIAGTVRVTNGTGGGNDSVSVIAASGTLRFGSISLGSGGYVTATTDFAATITWTPATLELRALLSGVNPDAKTKDSSSNNTHTYTPDGAVTDLAGNAAVGTRSYTEKAF